MWIMIIKSLPVDPQPPKLSIFWSTAWPFSEEDIQKQQMKYVREDMSQKWGDFEPDYKSESFLANTGFGLEPNFALTRRIIYRGQPIRVYAHEFSICKPENLKLYVLGDDNAEPSHYLVPENLADETLLQDIRKGAKRRIYEAALLDGCTHPQALMVANGKDISIDEIDIPALGWYVCHPVYAEMYCENYEIKNLKEDFEKSTFGGV